MAKLEVWGNQNTMNLENILYNNVVSCAYFKDLMRLKTCHEVVDEIYSEVSTLEPWISSAGKVPSTAFCLLYKLFTIKVNLNQMNGILRHKDSPYIRAIGFLYLRYVCPPKKLWGWFEQYLEDDEPIGLKGTKGKPTTIGEFARNLLVEARFLDTILPRIPVPITRELQQHLKEYDQAMMGEKGQTGKQSSNQREDSRDNRRRSPMERSTNRNRSRSRSREGRRRSRSRSRSRDREERKRRSNSRERRRDRSRSRERERRRRSRSRSNERRRRSRSRDRRRSRSNERRKRSRSNSPSLSPRKKTENQPSKPATTSLNKILEMYVKPTTSGTLDSQSSTVNRGDTNCQEETIILGKKK